MLAVATFIIGAIIAWKLGRRYQDFQDLMLARRVSKLVVQREQLAREQDEYERYERQDREDKRLAKLDQKLKEEIQ